MTFQRSILAPIEFFYFVNTAFDSATPVIRFHTYVLVIPTCELSMLRSPMSDSPISDVLVLKSLCRETGCAFVPDFNLPNVFFFGFCWADRFFIETSPSEEKCTDAWRALGSPSLMCGSKK